MADSYFALRNFFDAGGPVLTVIFVVAVVLWSLIIERYWYHWQVFPGQLAALRSKWSGVPPSRVPQARKSLRKDLGVLHRQLNGPLYLIRALIALCPLLGLLGTVTGMIHVFDTLSFSGTGNPRAMAAGVSMATIPTMSGLVVALSGFIFSIRLQRGSEAKIRLATDVLLEETAMKGAKA